MPSPQRLALAELIAAKPIRKVSDLFEAGISKKCLRLAVDQGDVIRLVHGVVARPDVESHPQLDDLLACLTTGGIICHRTAGQRHGLTDDVPPELEMLVPHNTHRPVQSLPIAFVRSRLKASFTEGVESREILGVDYRITDRTRTVIDLVRGPIRQHAVAAVHTYVAEGGDGQDLDRMARHFGVQDKVGPLVEATLQAMSRSIGR